MFFSDNSNYPIGLDISETSLKIIQLRKSRNNIKIQAVGRIDLPKGYFENGRVKNKEGIVNALKELINNPEYGKTTSKEVVACLPETKTFIKLIEVERTPNDINNIIEAELEKQIPMPITDIYYDWQIIEELPGKIMILIGAAPKNVVDEYIDLLSSAKLSVNALEIEPVTICRALLYEENPKFREKINRNYGIIDIGANRTSMIFYSRKTILFTVSMPISGNKITEKIADTLKIDTKQAEKAKIICGLDDNKAQGIVKGILSEMINDLSSKIGTAIQYYQKHFPDRGALDEIILCGGMSNIKNLDKIIQESTGINTKNGNALINIKGEDRCSIKAFEEKHNIDINAIENKKNNHKTEGMSVIQDNSLTYITSIGLSLREFFNNKD